MTNRMDNDEEMWVRREGEARREERHSRSPKGSGSRPQSALTASVPKPSMLLMSSPPPKYSAYSLDSGSPQPYPARAGADD